MKQNILKDILLYNSSSMFQHSLNVSNRHIGFSTMNNIIHISGVNDNGNSLKFNKGIGDNLICKCGNSDLIEDHSQGALICQTCGQVLCEIIDYTPEWKQYDDSDVGNVRCGAPINVLLPQSSLSTSIGGMGYNRIKTLHNWHAMPYKERSLNNEFKKIHEICQRMKIPKCVEDDTKIMCKMASECRHKNGRNKGKFIITRGNNRISISAACLFFACQKKSMLYTPREIAESFGIKYAIINRGIKKLRTLIDVKPIVPTNTTGAQNTFIRRFCDNLKILNIHTDEILKIANNIEKLNIGTEHNQYSLAAASILLVAERHKLKHVTKKRLAVEFGISDVTINKTYKKIESLKNIIFDEKNVEMVYNEISKSAIDIPDNIKAKMIEFGIVPPIVVEHQNCGK